MARDFGSKGFTHRNFFSFSRPQGSSLVLKNPPTSWRHLLRRRLRQETPFPFRPPEPALKSQEPAEATAAQAVSVSDVHTSTLEKLQLQSTVLPTKHLFGHNGTMMTRTNSRSWEAGRLFILPVTGSPGPRLHTGIPAYRPHRAVARAGPRRQNSS